MAPCKLLIKNTQTLQADLPPPEAAQREQVKAQSNFLAYVAGTLGGSLLQEILKEILQKILQGILQGILPEIVQEILQKILYGPEPCPELDPTRPDPIRPDPTRTEPTRPDPTRPDPARPDPIRPDPTARADPTDPTRPDPTRPDPRRLSRSRLCLRKTSFFSEIRLSGVVSSVSFNGACFFFSVQIFSCPRSIICRSIMSPLSS